MDTNIDYQILLQLCRELSAETVAKMELVLSSDPDALMRFREVQDIVAKAHNKEPAVSTIKKAWSSPRMSTNRFDELLDRYIERYIQLTKKYNGRGTTADLYSRINGQAKWYRMRTHRGARPQYHDDVRMICLLCELNCSETIEFLWTAGHPLMAGDLRDDIIADCILKGIRDPEEVNAKLTARRQAPLFTYV